MNTQTIKAVAYIDNEIKQAILKEWYAIAALPQPATGNKRLLVSNLYGVNGVTLEYRKGSNEGDVIFSYHIPLSPYTDEVHYQGLRDDLGCGDIGGTLSCMASSQWIID